MDQPNDLSYFHIHSIFVIGTSIGRDIDIRGNRFGGMILQERHFCLRYNPNQKCEMRKKILALSYKESKDMGFIKRDTALSEAECHERDSFYDECSWKGDDSGMEKI